MNKGTSKENQIQDYERKKLIEELSKMPDMVIATAYLHAINYTLYGEDVTEKWLTAVQNSSGLEKAYEIGYYDGLQRMRAEREETIEKLKAQLDYAKFRCALPTIMDMTKNN